jgi:hypothetical protein
MKQKRMFYDSTLGVQEEETDIQRYKSGKPFPGYPPVNPPIEADLNDPDYQKQTPFLRLTEARSGIELIRIAESGRKSMAAILRHQAQSTRVEPHLHFLTEGFPKINLVTSNTLQAPSFSPKSAEEHKTVLVQLEDRDYTSLPKNLYEVNDALAPGRDYKVYEEMMEGREIFVTLKAPITHKDAMPYIDTIVKFNKTMGILSIYWGIDYMAVVEYWGATEGDWKNDEYDLVLMRVLQSAQEYFDSQIAELNSLASKIHDQGSDHEMATQSMDKYDLILVRISQGVIVKPKKRARGREGWDITLHLYPPIGRGRPDPLHMLRTYGPTDSYDAMWAKHLIYVGLTESQDHLAAPHASNPEVDSDKRSENINKGIKRKLTLETLTSLSGRYKVIGSADTGWSYEHAPTLSDMTSALKMGFKPLLHKYPLAQGHFVDSTKLRDTTNLVKEQDIILADFFQDNILSSKVSDKAQLAGKTFSMVARVVWAAGDSPDGDSTGVFKEEHEQRWIKIWDMSGNDRTMCVKPVEHDKTAERCPRITSTAGPTIALNDWSQGDLENWVGGADSQPIKMSPTALWQQDMRPWASDDIWKYPEGIHRQTSGFGSKWHPMIGPHDPRGHNMMAAVRDQLKSVKKIDADLVDQTFARMMDEGPKDSNSYEEFRKYARGGSVCFVCGTDFTSLGRSTGYHKSSLCNCNGYYEGEVCMGRCSICRGGTAEVSAHWFCSEICAGGGGRCRACNESDAEMGAKLPEIIAVSKIRGLGATSDLLASAGWNTKDTETANFPHDNWLVSWERCDNAGYNWSWGKSHNSKKGRKRRMWGCRHLDNVRGGQPKPHFTDVDSATESATSKFLAAMGIILAKQLATAAAKGVAKSRLPNFMRFNNPSEGDAPLLGVGGGRRRRTRNKKRQTMRPKSRKKRRAQTRSRPRSRPRSRQRSRPRRASGKARRTGRRTGRKARRTGRKSR